MAYIDLYKSVLEKLSLLPVSYLQQVDRYLSSLTINKPGKEESKREAILALAGSWSEMKEDEFQDYLQQTKKAGSEMFSREINL